jgi:hypothetical protein
MGHQCLHNGKQRVFGFTFQDAFGATPEEFGGVIGGIRAVNDHPRAGAPSDVNHFPSEFPHPRQAHLGQKIEIVLVDRDNFRLVCSQGISETRLRFLEHAIEYGDGNSVRLQQTRCVERSEGRVRFHLADLFAVIGEMIGMR